GVLRCTDRPLAGPSGALLPVRLGSTAGDLSPGPAAMRPLPGRRLLSDNDLVDQRYVRLHPEDVLGQVDVDLGGHHSAPFALVLAPERIIARPPRGPGTAPRSRIRPFSVSTSWTVSPRVVTRSLPIRPAMPSPLNTRPGVAQPPIEPGLRWLRCWPWLALTPANPCRFITPAKPLPLLVPVTSTTSPAAKRSGPTGWPT